MDKEVEGAEVRATSLIDLMKLLNLPIVQWIIAVLVQFDPAKWGKDWAKTLQRVVTLAALQYCAREVLRAEYASMQTALAAQWKTDPATAKKMLKAVERASGDAMTNP